MIYHQNNIAGRIKDTLEMDEVARFYGFEPNRAGFIRCPFHSGDNTASLKIYQGKRGWHCFGCGKGGSVIDFAMELFDLNFRQAVLRLNSDFNLGFSSGGEVDVAAASRLLQQRKKEQEELEKFRKVYQSKTVLHRKYWEAIQSGEETPLYFEALRELPIIENWFYENPWR